ncbi:unnamed protein product, partial [Protopolystoma xenopodis]
MSIFSRFIEVNPALDIYCLFIVNTLRMPLELTGRVTRPKRSITRHTAPADDFLGLSWQEERELRRAMYDSLRPLSPNILPAERIRELNVVATSASLESASAVTFASPVPSSTSSSGFG